LETHIRKKGKEKRLEKKGGVAGQEKGQGLRTAKKKKGAVFLCDFRKKKKCRGPEASLGGKRRKEREKKAHPSRKKVKKEWIFPPQES